MSWNPFNKRVATRKGLKGEDCEFDSLSTQLTQVEASSKRVYKDMKRYMESTQNVAKANQKIFQELSVSVASVSTDDEFADNVERMKALSFTLSELTKELNSNVSATFTDPMKAFHETIPTVHSAMKRREQSLQDYSKYLSRKEKYQEKEQDTRLAGKVDANEKYLGAAKFDFEKRNKQLLEDLPLFFNCRRDYFLPCIDGLLRSQYLYYQNASDCFEQLGAICDQLPLTSDPCDGDEKRELEASLKDIMSLSIVRGK